MRTAEVLSYYGNSQVAIARALNLSRSSVNAWFRRDKLDLVPPLQAARLQEKTGGALKFDPADYVNWNKVKPKSRRKRT